MHLMTIHLIHFHVQFFVLFQNGVGSLCDLDYVAFAEVGADAGGVWVLVGDGDWEGVLFFDAGACVEGDLDGVGVVILIVLVKCLLVETSTCLEALEH